jgi:hypothetical protein
VAPDDGHVIAEVVPEDAVEDVDEICPPGEFCLVVLAFNFPLQQACDEFSEHGFAVTEWLSARVLRNETDRPIRFVVDGECRAVITVETVCFEGRVVIPSLGGCVVKGDWVVRCNRAPTVCLAEIEFKSRWKLPIWWVSTDSGFPMVGFRIDACEVAVISTKILFA